MKKNLKYVGQSNGGGPNTAAHAEVTAAPTAGKRTRILIVEDEPAMVAGLPGMAELNIGHSLVARAIFVGLGRAVREMKEAIRA